MTGRGILLVPDLALERWPSMDRYADALAARLPVRVAPEARTMGGPRYLARYLRYPRALRRHTPGVVHIADHSYAHCLAAFPATPAVITIHDLHPVHQLRAGPRTARERLRNVLLARTIRWVARADRLVAGTRFVAEEAARLLELPPDRLRVVPSYGVDEAFFNPPDARALAARRAAWLDAASGGRADARIVLHVGSCVPRKNVEAVIAAVAALRRSGVDAVLVQIGGTFSAAQAAALRAAGLERHVVQEPRIGDERLREAYHAADALLLPSLYEGFGLPALEALAAGLPVVTSGAGGLREAGGDAAVVVDPAAPDALASALGALWSDPTDRTARRRRGVAHARKNDWDTVAARMLAIYRELDPFV